MLLLKEKFNMSITKAMHNAKWTSNDKYKENYEKIFNKANNKNYGLCKKGEEKEIIKERKTLWQSVEN